MARSEPEVLTNKGATCCHCQPRRISLRHHDHGHRLHQRGFHLPVENTIRESDAAVSQRRHRHRLARSPRRIRRSRTPAVRRQEQTGPSLLQPRFRSFRHHGLFYLTSTTCLLLGKLIWKLRQDGFQRICNGQLRLFHRIHNRSSLTGQQQRPPVQGSQAPRPDTRKPAVPLTPPQRKSTDPKPVSKPAQNAPSSSQAPSRNPFPDQWVMAPWQALRSNAARTALVRKYQRPFASLRDPERFRCAQFLLSLFPEPVTDNTIGQEEFFGFVNCILQSRLNYERHFQEGASLFHNVEENVVGYRFKCVGFPGPPVAAQNWHLWAHATKNCSGVVFAGLLPSGHVKGKCASTSYENNLARFHALVHSCSSDKRWAIRFAAARIDFVFVLSDRNKANYPRQENPPRRRGPKAISSQPTLALTDGHVDESWGKWSTPFGKGRLAD